ncbi:hypothetical protein [Goodfellowiella coeruleoviolacea]|uniref:hypothetical protein n=1 Tax=Goodfellowiella coeruleoviolacea TaxID=334858 RepID=UPI0020A37E7F|nr:hypothetical protein [Goodfellowiella coeruleoviolacea]
MVERGWRSQRAPVSLPLPTEVVVDVPTELVVFLVLGLAGLLSLGGLWLHLITAFPLDDHPTREQPRPVGLALPRAARRRTLVGVTAPGPGREVVVGLPHRHHRAVSVHFGQEAA